MEVILIKDLKRKGTFGDVIEVADGYARNYLIPNGFALVANKTNKKRFEEIKEKAMLDVTKLREALNETAGQIKDKVFSMTALSRDGKLYGSITPSVIVEQIKAELPEIKINASDVIIEEGNIKYVGKYDCKAQFTKDISASFVMNIESDESHEQPELLESIIEGTEIIEDSNDEVSADEEASDEDATESVDQITETGEDADANEVSDEAEVPETDQP